MKIEVLKLRGTHGPPLLSMMPESYAEKLMLGNVTEELKKSKARISEWKDDQPGDSFGKEGLSVYVDCGAGDFLSESLNSGDGTYRP